MADTGKSATNDTIISKKTDTEKNDGSIKNRSLLRYVEKSDNVTLSDGLYTFRAVIRHRNQHVYHDYDFCKCCVFETECCVFETNNKEKITFCKLCKSCDNKKVIVQFCGKCEKCKVKKYSKCPQFQAYEEEYIVDHPKCEQCRACWNSKDANDDKFKNFLKDEQTALDKLRKAALTEKNKNSNFRREEYETDQQSDESDDEYYESPWGEPSEKYRKLFGKCTCEDVVVTITKIFTKKITLETRQFMVYISNGFFPKENEIIDYVQLGIARCVPNDKSEETVIEYWKSHNITVVKDEDLWLAINYPQPCYQYIIGSNPYADRSEWVGS